MKLWMVDLYHHDLLCARYLVLCYESLPPSLVDDVAVDVVAVHHLTNRYSCLHQAQAQAQAQQEILQREIENCQVSLLAMLLLIVLSIVMQE